MIVGIDAMVVIYAGLAPNTGKNSPNEREELRVRAMILLHELREQKATICLPTVAISELLVPVPMEDRALLSSKLAAKFFCPVFDLRSAEVAAKLHAEHKQLIKVDQYANRTHLKADSLIVASCRAAGAETFYTSDPKCRKLAKLVMDARDLPRKAADLYLEQEIRSGEYRVTD